MSNASIFVRRAIIFSMLLIAIDQFGGRIIEYFFHRSDIPEYSRIGYALDKATEPIMVYGSSRAVHHYIPQVLASKLNLDCYNAGKDGHYISYESGLLNGRLKRGTPRIVIIDLNPFEFEKDRYADIAPFLPYYTSHPNLRSLIRSRGTYERIKIFSWLYRYNSLIVSILTYNLIPNGEHDDMNGFIPLNRKVKSAPLRFNHFAKEKIDPAVIATFRGFLNRARQAGSEVYVMVSPHYVIYGEPSPTISIASQICREMKVSFYDDSQDDFFLHHPEMFADAGHLNKDGAKLYTLRAADRLTRTLSQREGSAKIF